MNDRRLLWRLVGGPGGVLLLALALAGCGQAGGEVRIVLDNMRFRPGEVRLTAGEAVTLTLVNRDGYAHAFDIDALGIHVPLPAQATATVSFTPADAQLYTFYCGVTGHDKAGMVGTLNVVAQAGSAR